MFLRIARRELDDDGLVSRSMRFIVRFGWENGKELLMQHIHTDDDGEGPFMETGRHQAATKFGICSVYIIEI